jgi:tripartite-type tricarboxylate transporter receptor subunit TctC
MRYFGFLLVAASSIVLSPRNSIAQGVAGYPTKAIRVIVGAAPGGGTDLRARKFAHAISKNLGQQVVIDNRPGGGNTVGYGLVAQSAPDGYTLGAVTPSLTFSPALRSDLPYDPVKDFAPISLLTKAPFLLLAHPALPVKSVKELIALARARPGALDMGVGSSGSSTHLAAAYFASAADIRVTFIPYKGASQVSIDAISGQIHVFFSGIVSELPHVKSGRLRVLAVTSAGRSSVLPSVPTISEAGVRGYDVTVWHGWVAPARTPAAVVNRLNAELVKAVRSPDVAASLAEQGEEPAGGTPEQFRQLITAEIPRWSSVVKRSGMRVE